MSHEAGLPKGRPTTENEVNSLCEVCRTTFIELGLTKRSGGIAFASNSQIQVHHQASFSALEYATQNECPMCSLLLRVARDSEKKTQRENVHFNAAISFQRLDSNVAPTSHGSASFRIHIAPGEMHSSFLNHHLKILDFDIWEDPPTERSRINGSDVRDVPPLDLACHWLETCLEKHEKCRRNASSDLPTRLLDIGTTKADLRLWATEDLEPTQTFSALEYIALSHCWGTKRPEILLQQSNLHQFTDTVPYDSLARNFREAIEITRSLGFRYLWIDCLCIVQDDQEEWQRECPQMDSVFTNAVLTIAAADASDPDDGILNHRHILDDPPSCTLILPVSETGTTKIHVKLTTSADSFVLEKRGWACQERLLSHRMLYFFSDRIYFVCQSSHWDERWLYPLNKVGDLRLIRNFTGPDWLTGRKTTTPADPIEFYKIVHQYSACSLTKADDRLPALSGIAKRFHAHSGAKYLAGIWSTDFVHGLGWRSEASGRAGLRPIAFQEPPRYNAPSWSWASCRYAVLYWDRGLYPYRLEAEILGFDCSVVGLDPFGQVSSGYLTMRGPVVMGNIRKTGEPELASLEVACIDSEGETSNFGSLYLDDEDGLRCRNIGEHVLCMPFASMGNTESGHEFGWDALVLVEVDDRPDTFRRLGLLSRLGWHEGERESFKWVSGGSHRTVTII